MDCAVNDGKGRYIGEQSFTFLQWKMIENLKKGILSPEQVDSTQLKNLCYNIFPGGETVLHKLYNNNDLLMKIFNQAHPNVEDRTAIEFEVPLFEI